MGPGAFSLFLVADKMYVCEEHTLMTFFLSTFSRSIADSMAMATVARFFDYQRVGVEQQPFLHIHENI